MLDKITKRADKLNEWLKETGVKKEQAHLNKDSKERLYWHYGYFVALKDVLALLDKEVISESKYN